MKREEGVTDKVQPRKLGPRKRTPIQMASDTTIKALMAKGFSVRKAAAFMGISPTTAQKAMTRLREQGEEVQPLLSAQRDEKLGRLVDHFLDKGIKLEAVKGSDALGVAKLYADRRYPAREAAPPVSYSFSRVNIQEARYDYKPPDDAAGEEPVLITLAEDKGTGEEPT